ncbi:MAG: biotin transporter BioY [Roseburia sp.]|nr:biotin transporter BioY [Roseburia sp.]MDY5884172.1 biotin transporter BioY [Roseburia sp.]
MKVSTKTIVTVGMFTAVLAVLSILTIPMPSGVPVTLQTFAMALCGYVLGAKKGTLSTVLYVVIGAIGVPVYAGMSGGVGVLFGYTGGFLFGFIFMTLLCGLGLSMKNKVLQVVFGLLGLVVCHLFGVIWFSVVAASTFVNSFLVVSVPYLLKDVTSVVAAYFVAIAIRKALYASKLMEAKA